MGWEVAVHSDAVGSGTRPADFTAERDRVELSMPQNLSSYVPRDPLRSWPKPLDEQVLGSAALLAAMHTFFIYLPGTSAVTDIRAYTEVNK